MENATKALLISAAVLIAIVLIAVGIKILGSTTEVTDQVNEVSTTMAVSIFNSQFTQFQGNARTKGEVETLINRIDMHNATNPEKPITKTGVTSASSLVYGKTYAVSITGYDGNGYVKTVSISQNS